MLPDACLRQTSWCDLQCRWQPFTCWLGLSNAGACTKCRRWGSIYYPRWQPDCRGHTVPGFKTTHAMLHPAWSQGALQHLGAAVASACHNCMGVSSVRGQRLQGCQRFTAACADRALRSLRACPELLLLKCWHGVTSCSMLSWTHDPHHAGIETRVSRLPGNCPQCWFKFSVVVSLLQMSTLWSAVCLAVQALCA